MHHYSILLQQQSRGCVSSVFPQDGVTKTPLCGFPCRVLLTILLTCAHYILNRWWDRYRTVIDSKPGLQKMQSRALTHADITSLMDSIDVYSGSDLRCLVQQASRGVGERPVIMTESTAAANQFADRTLLVRIIDRLQTTL